jgi:outer membrane beta-barrel protein
MGPSAIRVFALSLAAFLDRAQAQPVLENVAVRNRMYRMQSKFELAPSVGFGLAPHLINHVNFALGAAYNLTDAWAAELRASYALSGHTATADQVGQNFLQLDPARRLRLTDDLSGLWEMKGSGLLGIRWAPIYGKLSLFSELPVHFQGYLWAGGGVGRLHRESVVYCRQVSSRDSGACADWLKEDATRAVASAAAGFRFFTSQRGSIRVELRDYIFRDSYLTSVDRVLAERGEPTGVPARSPGLINLFMFEFGYTFIF